MAELLIRIVDKTTSADPVFDALIAKRGDVVTIQNDGWPWSPAERAGNPWVIVKAPGVSAALLTSFIAKDDGDPAQHFVPRRRALRFDVSLWQAQGSPNITSVAQAQAFRVTLPRVSDPSVLG